MNKINSFEDLIAWQKARIFNQRIYKVSDARSFSNDFALKDQVRRASISIVSNIAEGFERNGNREFVQYLSIAKASNAEVRSHLYIALDLGYVSKNLFEELINLSEEIGKIINGLMHYLQSSDLRGAKFKEENLNYFPSHKNN
jgi:four helix bundle protein